MRNFTNLLSSNVLHCSVTLLRSTAVHLGFVNGIDNGKKESLFLLSKNRAELLSQYLWDAYNKLEMLSDSLFTHIDDRNL